MNGVQWGARIGCRLIDRTVTLCKGGRNTRVLGVTRKGRDTSETGNEKVQHNWLRCTRDCSQCA